MGEEWRRRWHPEFISPKVSDNPTLVVGAGPAGLECALQLARRGYPVTLAEASSQLGGRVPGESSLKGLSAWLRVRDNRVYELERMANVEIFLESRLSAEDILEFPQPQAGDSRYRPGKRPDSGRHHEWYRTAEWPDRRLRR